MTRPPPRSARPSEVLRRPTLSEATWRRTVLDLAAECGWEQVPTAPPWLVLCRKGWVAVVVVRGEDGRLNPAEQRTLAEARRAGNVHAELWRPGDVARVRAFLARPEPGSSSRW